MIESREFQKLVKQWIVLSLCLFLLSFVSMKITIHFLSEQMLKQQASMIQNVLELDSFQEDELIRALVDYQKNPDKGYDVLEKYGIHEKSLSDFVAVDGLKNKVFICHLVFFFLIFIVLSCCYLYHIRKFYKKLDKVNLYIHDVLNDQYTFNIKEYEEGTFATLKNDVYKITNKLREQNENMKKDKKYLEETLSDISHQLKTPLTSMYMINNLLEDDHLDKKKRKEFLAKNQIQLERIEWLVTSLLKLSRLESGTIQLKKEKVKVIDLVKNALEPLKIPMELKEQKLIFKGKMDTKIVCDLQWTTEAILNILKNAYEHTGEKGMIEIVWQDNPLYVSIFITDTGEGIKEEDIKHIFERFYRAKDSSKESIGIGLNMAKQVIDRQNGDISVRSIVGKGTEFCIKFYKS